ncbi:MAG: CaiB/BaiF CoA-transferase family protein [Acidobacteriota bacterium]|nr:CaiB/BaiF CoA-transferase family protein [Acidobacteriota bacterium]
MPGPLAGFTVLDLTRVLSGPYCTMVLGDLGARIIKVEQPGKGDDTRAWGPPFIGAESAYFLSINRNKESVTLDYKPAAGRAVLEKLVAQADVLVENFRPGTLERAGFGWEAMHERFPRLVYASIAGYGQTGPRRNEAGYDAVMQAEGGLMSVTGEADRPGYRLGVAITDMVSGLYCAQGITAALLARERSGRGQRVDIGMLDTTAALLTYQAANWFATGKTPQRQGNRHATIAPYETFTTADGEIVIAVGNDEIWKRFCPAAGLPELAGNPRFATNKDRMANYEEMRPPIDRVFRTATSAEWIARLNAAGVPNGEVRDIGQMLNDPHLAAREMVQTLMHPTIGATRVIGAPIKLSDTPASLRTAPPVLGQHTDAVLAELGYSPAEVAALRNTRVV